MTVEYSVGSEVRVKGLGPSGSLCCKATVTCVDSEESRPRVDVLLHNKASTAFCDGIASSSSEDDEEMVVESSRLEKLMDFEQGGAPVVTKETGEEWKVRGNALFKMGDAWAAGLIYEGVCKTLQPLTIGQAVMTRQQAEGGYRWGMISGMEECDSDSPQQQSCTYDVLFDEEQDGGEDEAEGVQETQLVSAAMDFESRCLHISCLLNLSRCHGKLHRWAEGVAVTTVVVALMKKYVAPGVGTREEREQLKRSCATAFELRATFHLSQNHIKLATKDAKSMVEWDPSSSKTKAAAEKLLKAIARQASSLKRDNKALVKEIAKLVESSMQKSGELQAEGGRHEQQLAIQEEKEEEEEEEEEEDVVGGADEEGRCLTF